MASGERPSGVRRILAEWPALLAVLVLVAGHVYLTGIRGQDITPIGIPLFAAIAVFLLAEFARRMLVDR